MSTTETHGKAMELVAKNSHLSEFTTRVEELLDQASRVLVNTDEDYDKAGDLLKFLKDVKKDLDEQRKEDTRPMREATDEINGRYKKYLDRLDANIRLVNDAIVKYANEKRRIEQERREQEALEKAERNPDHADAYLNEGAKEVKPTTHTSTHGARTSVRRTLKSVEVVDWSQVPEEYKMLDEKKAKGSIRAGVNIPGLRAIYEESAVSR